MSIGYVYIPAHTAWKDLLANLYQVALTKLLTGQAGASGKPILTYLPMNPTSEPQDKVDAFLSTLKSAVDESALACNTRTQGVIDATWLEPISTTVAMRLAEFFVQQRYLDQTQKNHWATVLFDAVKPEFESVLKPYYARLTVSYSTSQQSTVQQTQASKSSSASLPVIAALGVGMLILFNWR